MSDHRTRSRPVIGITVDTDDATGRYLLHPGYATSVEKAGGLPLLLPYRTDISLIPQIVDLLDGVLFSGGNDLDPALYGETYHPKAAPIDPDRQRFELALLAEVEKRRTPALGICLGSQLMNVYRGGSLIQFLPDIERPETIEHRKLGTEMPRHGVNLEPQSAAAQTIGKTLLDANSSHKQAVKKLGRGLRIIGTSPDGVIEGIEDPSLPLFLGVQWHPERLHEEKDHLALFKLLVDRAAKH
ncbi:MAG TPA: gamma-glutamyl-gamma-aminobutyrate hydrolase family protein [Humisphaera sp.]|jgi:putative glutamine amidotransferase|nr:gamma-glutamyl-gamma-aminobutyrate hydrolase family protein [Humisphaera sp.]